MTYTKRKRRKSRNKQDKFKHDLGAMLSQRDKWIAELDSLKGKAKVDEFAGSLLHQFRTKGSLTDKQWYYVEELLKRLRRRV